MNYIGTYSGNNITDVLYKCDRASSNITISCGDLPISGSPSTYNELYGANLSNWTVDSWCGTYGYTCSGWKVYGTNIIPNMSSWDITDADVTLVPNCTTGE